MYPQSLTATWREAMNPEIGPSRQNGRQLPIGLGVDEPEAPRTPAPREGDRRPLAIGERGTLHLDPNFFILWTVLTALLGSGRSPIAPPAAARPTATSPAADTPIATATPRSTPTSTPSPSVTPSPNPLAAARVLAVKPHEKIYRRNLEVEVTRLSVGEKGLLTSEHSQLAADGVPDYFQE